jgi:perosamine synthetase
MAKTILQFAPFLDEQEYAALRECFDANWLTEGPKAREFLARLKQQIGFEFGCLAPNGTLALYLGLRALGIGPGDDVVVPDFTFFGSASAVEMTGADPIFCDVDPETLQAGAEHFESALTPRTRALMPVHIYGMACPIAPIVELARQRELAVIEDAAQAIEVFYAGRHAGTFGDVGCFSFFADKTLTTGEGGLVVTNSAEIHQKLLFLRNQGRTDRGSFVHEALGYNFRMTDLQAAIGLVQISKLEEIKRRKSRILHRYHERLDPIEEVRFISLTPGSSYVPFRIAIYAQRATDLMRHLELQNIQTRTFFYPLHRQPAFEPLRRKPGYAGRLADEAFPGAIRAYENGVCLPSYPGLPPEDLDTVCDRIIEFYAGR